LANGNGLGAGKFYVEQVEELVPLLERLIKFDPKEYENYLKVCEHLGNEPDEDKVPPTMDQFPLEVQQALEVFDLLPDRFDSMAGSYYGKDLSSIESFLRIYEVDNSKLVVFFVSLLNRLQIKFINKRLEEQRKREERKNKNVKK
jgi:hypothetical protein